VIVRLAGEGQFTLDDDELPQLNELDNRAVAAVEAGDEAGFRSLLDEMIAHVREAGTPVPAEELHGSDVIIPPADTTLAEARAEFSGDGLIPD
jgi:hypothetical protein